MSKKEQIRQELLKELELFIDKMDIQDEHVLYQNTFHRYVNIKVDKKREIKFLIELSPL